MKNLATTLIILLIALFTSACGWTNGEKVTFMDGCLNGAKAQNVKNSEEYCDCMLAKMERDFNDLESMYMATPTQLDTMANACVEQVNGKEIVWSSTSEEIIKNECLKMAAENKVADAENYCNCVVNKLKTKYDTEKELAALNADTVKKYSAECK